MKQIWPRLSDEAMLRLTLAILIIGGIIAYFADSIFIAVPPGHAAVLWSRFFGGTVTSKVYHEGMHIFLPWDRVTLYDVRVRDVSEKIDSITQDGLHISLNLDVRYHLIIDQLGFLQREVGPDYERSVLRPMANAFLRGQVARYTAAEVYSTQRAYIERVVLDYLRLNRTVLVRAGLEGTSFMNYDAVMVNEVTLPPAVQQAIEQKVAQYEASLEWQFRVQRERLESQRRTIEAEETRHVLDLLGDRLTDTFVRLRYVEALERLIQSPNAKLIVTAPTNSNAPVLFNAETGNPAAVPASPVTGPARP